MKKLILLFVAASLLSGCAHSTWDSVERHTRVAGFLASPVAAVNMFAKAGSWVTTRDQEDPEIIILENGKAVLK